MLGFSFPDKYFLCYYLLMPKRVTSRLVKKKQKQMTKQTLGLLSLAVIILLFFLLFLLPKAIGIFFAIIGTGTDYEEIDVIVPQKPVIHAPPIATNSAQLKLEGYTEPESEVYLQINSQEQDKQQADKEGQFVFEAKLKNGTNRIVIFSEDEAGNQSEKTLYDVERDTESPEIKIGEPEDGAEFFSREDRVIEVKGETEPKSQVYVNDLLTYANEDGLFSLRFPLNEGENPMKIRAVDQAGNASEIEMQVKYRD